MKLDVFLSFNGQAEEAFRFYADLFQTEIKGLVRASEMMDPANFPAEKRDKIAWIALDTENLTLNGEDVGIFNDLSIPSNHQPNQWLGNYSRHGWEAYWLIGARVGSPLAS